MKTEFSCSSLAWREEEQTLNTNVLLGSALLCSVPFLSCPVLSVLSCFGFFWMTNSSKQVTMHTLQALMVGNSPEKLLHHGSLWEGLATDCLDSAGVSQPDYHLSSCTPSMPQIPVNLVFVVSNQSGQIFQAPDSSEGRVDSRKWACPPHTSSMVQHHRIIGTGRQLPISIYVEQYLSQKA